MFCQKCGTQLSDGATFCHKCGAKLTAEVAPQAAPVQAAPQVAPQAAPVQVMPPQKKSKKKFFIIGGIILAVIIVIVVAMGSGGGSSINYVATVQAHKPYNSQGMPYTYGEVFEKYLSNIVWEANETDTGADVLIDGIGTGTDMQVTFTITVTPNPDNPESVKITPKSAVANGTTLSTEDEVSQIFYILFSAYSEDIEDFAAIRDTLLE